MDVAELPEAEQCKNRSHCGWIQTTEIESQHHRGESGRHHGYSYRQESAGGVVVTTPASDAGGTGSIPGTGSCDVNIWLSTLGTVYPS